MISVNTPAKRRDKIRVKNLCLSKCTVLFFLGGRWGERGGLRPLGALLP